MSNRSFWDYYVKLPSDNYEKKAMCKLCNETYNYTATSYNLKTHLNRKHSDTITMELIPKRKKRIVTFKHKIWGYFTKLEGVKRAKCNICLKELSYRSTVANLSCHLQFKHPDAHERFLHNKPPIRQDFGRESQLDVSDNNEDTQEESQKLNDLWNYFEQEGTKVRCVVCRQVLEDTSYDNLKEHLFAQHPKLLLQLVREQDQDTKSNASDDEDNTYTEVVYLEQDSASDDTARTSDKPKIISTYIQNRPQKRTRINSSTDHQIIKVKKDSEPQKEREEKQEEESELDTFIKYIRCLLKKLSPDVFSKVQVDILKTIMDAQYSNNITNISHTSISASSVSRPSIITDVATCSGSNVTRVNEIVAKKGPLVGNYTLSLAPEDDDLETKHK